MFLVLYTVFSLLSIFRSVNDIMNQRKSANYVNYTLNDILECEYCIYMNVQCMNCMIIMNSKQWSSDTTDKICQIKDDRGRSENENTIVG